MSYQRKIYNNNFVELVSSTAATSNSSLTAPNHDLNTSIARPQKKPKSDTATTSTGDNSQNHQSSDEVSTTQLPCETVSPINYITNNIQQLQEVHRSGYNLRSRKVTAKTTNFPNVNANANINKPKGPMDIVDPITINPIKNPEQLQKSNIRLAIIDEPAVNNRLNPIPLMEITGQDRVYVAKEKAKKPTRLASAKNSASGKATTTARPYNTRANKRLATTQHTNNNAGDNNNIEQRDKSPKRNNNNTNGSKSRKNVICSSSSTESSNSNSNSNAIDNSDGSSGSTTVIDTDNDNSIAIGSHSDSPRSWDEEGGSMGSFIADDDDAEEGKKAIGALLGYIKDSANRRLRGLYGGSLSSEADDESYVYDESREAKLDELKEKLAAAGINMNTYRTMISSNGDDQIKKYYRSLPVDEQIKLILLEQELQKMSPASRDIYPVNNINNTNTINQPVVNVPLRVKILQMDIDPQIKTNILKKYDTLMSSADDNTILEAENWLDTVMRIPWNKKVALPITYEMGYEKITEALTSVKQHMDSAIYGQNRAKSVFLETIGEWIVNPECKGLTLGFEGQPGTGKTSLMKHGVSYALGRPFVTINLGGARDGGFLDGDSAVWRGSKYGKIVETLIECQCMNPIFYFDELDKLSNTEYGKEISNILIHLTDPENNGSFYDKYLGVTLDLSGSTFIFSYNNAALIDPILLNRFKKIHFDSYRIKDKLVIAQKYTIPALLSNLRFNPEDIVFTENIIKYIINEYAEQEHGMRSLSQYLHTIITKINLIRITTPDFYKNLYRDDRDHKLNRYSLNITLPCTLQTEMVDLLLDKDVNRMKLNSINSHMYI